MSHPLLTWFMGTITGFCLGWLTSEFFYIRKQRKMARDFSNVMDIAELSLQKALRTSDEVH